MAGAPAAAALFVADSARTDGCDTIAPTSSGALRGVHWGGMAHAGVAAGATPGTALAMTHTSAHVRILGRWRRVVG